MAYLIASIIAFCALIPPIEFRIPAPHPYWPLFMTCASFAGLYLVFLPINRFVKFVAVVSFFNALMSSVPYVSFNAYALVILCCYFYVACTKIKNWTPIITALKVLFLLNCILLICQLFRQDQLLNFGTDKTVCFGVVGHKMQMSSFITVLSAIMVPVTPWFLLGGLAVSMYCTSVWGIFCCGLGMLIYSRLINKRLFNFFVVGLITLFVVLGFALGKFDANAQSKYGRSAVWYHSLRLASERPLMGWGIGSYKVVFHPLSQMQNIPYRQAHNCWIQFVFELGYPAALWILICFAYFMCRLYETTRRKMHRLMSYKLFIAALIIAVDMMVHFPTRMIQCVPLIICFLAYCEQYLHNLDA